MSLSRRILRQVLLVAGGASLLFGILFLGLYRGQLERERAASSEQVNRLLRGRSSARCGRPTSRMAWLCRRMARWVRSPTPTWPTP